MKTQLLKTSLILLGLVFGLTATSCTDDDDGGSGGNTPPGTMSAKIDGNNYQSSEMLSSATKTSNGFGGSETLTLLGNTNEGKTINITILSFDGTGTYEIGGDSSITVTASYIEVNTSNPSQSQTWQSPFDDTVSGTIDISSDENDNVQGTFEFTAQNSNDDSIKEITDGSFNMDYSSF